MAGKNGKVREDIHYTWLDIVASAQAAASTNGGWGVLTIEVVLRGKKPYSWVAPRLDKMHPMKLVDPDDDHEAGTVITAYLANRHQSG